MTLTLYGHRPDLGLCLAQQVKETVSRPFRFLLRVVCLLLLSLSLWQPARANDIKLNSVSVATGSILNGGTSDATVAVTIGLSWNNSWRTSFGPANWDAAWVFIKYRVGTTDPQLTGITTSNATFTVANTLWLRVGMPVSVTSGTGAFASGTVITAVNTSTRQVTVSNTPTTALSNATITCYRIWEHAKLSNTGHTPAAGYTVDMGRQNPASVYNADNNPNLGAFIYRSSSYSGNNTNFNTTLRWNIGRGGQGAVEVRVFAIEMVYVPQGSFYVGSGGVPAADVGEEGSFTNGSWTSGATIPFQITSEAALGIDNAAGKLWGTSTTGNSTIGNAPTDAEATLPAAYPKGFGAFYCMKYEVSQGQYRDFLNTLTYSQQVSRTEATKPPNSQTGTVWPNGASTYGSARNGIIVQTPGNATTLVPAVYGCNLNNNTSYNEATDGEWIACHWMTWMDHCAYLDWAGLRPMTELEYEKACRGTLAPVANEYAWGTTTATFASNSLTNPGATNEVSSAVGANTTYDNQNNGDGTLQGPIRVGAFAGAATTRVQAGATYYGIMEMSGNLFERLVNLSSSSGRSYTGEHGDGSLSTSGHATTTNWPGRDGNGEVTGVTGDGSGVRGGEWFAGAGRLLVSNRRNAISTITDRLSGFGIRGVRSAQ